MTTRAWVTGASSQGFFPSVMGVFQAIVVEAQLIQDRGQELGQLTRPSTAR